MNRVLSQVVLGCAALALAACGGAPAPDLYVLRAPDSLAASACHHRVNLIVAPPTAAPEYATNRIAVMMNGDELTHYTGVAWASPFPSELQQFMVDALGRAHAYRAVTAASAEEKRGLRLRLAIRDAYVDQAQPPVVHLRLTATLTSGNRTFATVPIDEAAPAAANHMPDIVAAFATAAAQAAEKIAAVSCAR